MQATTRLFTVTCHVTAAERLLRGILAILLLFSVTACAVIPGSQTYGMREQSAIKVPVKEAGEVAPANVKVVLITAELIIEQERSRTAAATRTDEAKKGPTYPAVSDYKLGPGDIISVIVWDHPELTIPAGIYRSAEQSGNLVDADGNIFYPYAGTLHVAGKTALEVRSLLAQKLSKVVEKPQVDVRVVAFRSKRVYVVGEVKQPGLLEIDDVPLTIVDAVNKAGGFNPEADHSELLLTRKGATWRVDLQALYELGATDQNVLLEAGDIVNVPDRQFNKVFVLGEVKSPGAFLMNKKRITLAEALANAGYVDEFSANPHWIFVMRGQSDKPELYHLDSRSPDALLLADRFPLRPHDIIYVDAADVARWNRVISNILPTASLLSTTSSIRYPLFNGRQ
jgi:polysaccharide biosynthesis/export protein